MIGSQFQRASFGDPAWVADSHKVEREMLSEEFAAATRAKISDEHTLKVSAYNPEGFEILPEYVHLGAWKVLMD